MLARAWQLLARRPLARAEVGARLAQEGYQPAAVAWSLEQLESRSFLDDRELAGQVVQQRAFRRGYGRLRVHAELRRRGIAPALAAEALAGSLDEEAERELAMVVARRRLAGRQPENWQALARWVGPHLSRRGFTDAAIGRTLSELWHEVGGARPGTGG